MEETMAEELGNVSFPFLIRTRQPYRFIGGKVGMAPEIVRLMPRHHCYCEPFCGSAAVLFAKPLSPVEVVNDINGDLVNLLLQLRDNTKELIQKLQLTPYSRAYFEDCTKLWREGGPKDKLERALVWYYLQTAGMSGNFGAGWSHATTDNKATDYHHRVDGLRWLALRLRNVQIENRDYKQVIANYDSPDTFFYLDPPYLLLSEALAKAYYGSVFNIENHKELASVLSGIQGKAIVSYYPHKLLDELYAKWERIEIDVPKRSSGCEGDVEKPRATELLLFNYKPTMQLKLELIQEGEPV